MTQESILLFAEVRIDLTNECVWQGEQAIRLTPTAFALLRHLIEHAGQLVTKEKLLEALWPETAVTEGVLTTHVRQLRQALRDDPRAPRYIETVHRRGYRFIGKVVRSQHSVISRRGAGSDAQLTTPLVGRDAELTQLHEWLEKALHGERQIVFITGEAGIGKTTLVEAFWARLSSKHDHELWIGRGQCIEHYGTGEAYLPVLEALGRLCREPGGHRLSVILRQHAPTWLVQMPALLSSAELYALQRRTQGAARERMLRELAEALEVLTAERPLVLWLEDLHWSDVSTLDWLASVARRQERARLLVIGAYRPIDVIVGNHPLQTVKHELQLHEQCTELPLGFLTEAHVAEYLERRFAAPSPASAGEACPEPSRRSQDGGVSRGERKPITAGAVHKLAHLIHHRTDGNPLFMVNVTNELVAREVISQRDGHWELKGKFTNDSLRVPENLRQLIEQQLARVTPDERKVLEAASVAGAEFSAAAVAAGVGATVEEVEEVGSELAQRKQFLRARGASEWPDGTVAARYSFLHALYQEVLYDRLPAGRRQRRHRQIGEREEQAYGDRAREIASELAVHFEQGREYRKAIQYLQQAGENALRRSANMEAISHLTKGLKLLKALPNTPEHILQELLLQTTLGPALTATKGHAAPEVETTYTRARELCQQVGESPQLFTVLMGLRRFYSVRAELQTAHELDVRCLHLAQRAQDPALLVEAHRALGVSLFFVGELAQAREHLARGFAFHDPQQHRFLALRYGNDPGVACLSFTARALWLLGYPDQALQRSQEALTLAQQLTHSYSLAFTLCQSAVVYRFRRESQATQEEAERGIALSSEQGFTFPLTWGTILRGWALAEQGQIEEGIAQMRQGMTTQRAMGLELNRPGQLAELAWAYEKMGQAEEGVSVLAEALALVNKTGERFYEAELYRLKGELLLVQEGCRLQAVGYRAKTEEAEECFLQAIEIARRQQAKSLELRATTSLARLWQQHGKRTEARQMLAEIYNWFTEGFDTKDLQEAKALLEE